MADVVREFDVTAEGHDYVISVEYDDNGGHLEFPDKPFDVRRYAADWTAETPVAERTLPVAWDLLPASVQQIILSEMEVQAREAERERAEQEKLADEAARDSFIDRQIDERRGR